MSRDSASDYTRVCVCVFVSITDEVRADRVECVSVEVLYILVSTWDDRKKKSDPPHQPVS